MNVKPGDMAIITGAFPGSEGCLGLIVQVVEFAGTRRSSTDNLLHVDAWFLDGPHPGFERSRRQGYRIMHPDRWLRPVSGLPLSNEGSEFVKNLISIAQMRAVRGGIGAPR